MSAPVRMPTSRAIVAGLQEIIAMRGMPDSRIARNVARSTPLRGGSTTRKVSFAISPFNTSGSLSSTRPQMLNIRPSNLFGSTSASAHADASATASMPYALPICRARSAVRMPPPLYASMAAVAPLSNPKRATRSYSLRQTPRLTCKKVFGPASKCTPHSCPAKRGSPYKRRNSLPKTPLPSPPFTFCHSEKLLNLSRRSATSLSERGRLSLAVTAVTMKFPSTSRTTMWRRTPLPSASLYPRTPHSSMYAAKAEMTCSAQYG